MARLLRLAAVGGSVLLLLGAGGSGRSHLVQASGFVVRVPAGWHASSRPLQHVSGWVQRLMLSSAAVPSNAVAGRYVPPSRAVLAEVVEDMAHDDSIQWPKRPAHFTIPQLGGLCSLAGERWGELLFRSGGRNVFIFIWVGRHASRVQVASLMQALDSLRVRAS
jgi:hypothetical protein